MLGSIRWNVAFGFVGFITVFLFSIGGNGFSLTLMRAFYGFLAFFMLAFVPRVVLFMAVKDAERQANIRASGEEQQGQAGERLDMLTPDDQEDLNELLKSQLAGETWKTEAAGNFQPLKPPKLVSTQSKSPEALAQAVRELSEDDRK